MKKLLLFTFVLCLCMPLASSAQTRIGFGPGTGGGTGTGTGGGTGTGTGGGTGTGTGGGTGTGTGTDGGGYNDNIDVNPVPPYNPNRPEKSALNVVDAWGDWDLGRITVSFNREIGMTTVAIVNQMGQAVSVYTCDTSVEWEIWLPMPNDAGHYTLEVTGQSFAGVGLFDIY